MISVRLPEELEKKLNQLAESENVTKTYLVKEALNKYIAEKEEKKDSYQLGKDLFGRHGSKEGDLSTTYKKRVSDKIYEKYSR
ncbi:ribbon-helix-helix CopG family protein [Halanaerobium saccharolyticum]|uniref:Ribbon-helix-helix CopG family protein n=1 Tax=Halanaerobium saccharolyticum TaxID=43595 RepID=A0A4R6LYU4_9FIRM|nr:ribbon-helix-helix domain-containing protein [Halanaerobium saccharolyticum]TDO94051.1 ribbon-helix-helix CopG family protein [Halanaerobium saccharolyticum]